MMESSQHYKIISIKPWRIKGYVMILMQPVKALELPLKNNNQPPHITQEFTGEEGGKMIMMNMMDAIPQMMMQRTMSQDNDERHIMDIMKEETFFDYGWRVGDYIIVNMKIITKREDVKPESEISG